MRQLLFVVTLACLVQLFHLSAVKPLQASSGTGASIPASISQGPGVFGNKPWIFLLCKFSDLNREPKPPSYFVGLMGDQFGGMNHYWQEVSYGNITVKGNDVVDRWYSLPHPQSHYVENNDVDTDLVIDDCKLAAGANVDLSKYYGIHYILNAGWSPDDLDGENSVSRGGLTDYSPTQGPLGGFTLLPPTGYLLPPIMAHEMGHAFGLPHSSGAYGDPYENPWDLMSGGVLNHTISYHKALLGWIPFEKRVIVWAQISTKVTLEQLAQPQTANPLMIIVPKDDSEDQFYTVEVRRPVGYDEPFPIEAVVIHDVDADRGEPAHVVDSDGDGNNADPGTMWQVGEVFRDENSKITISILEQTATGFVVQVENGGQGQPRVFLSSLYLPSIEGRQ